MPAALSPRGGYRPRSATNALKELIEDHLDELFNVYDEKFRAEYGALHPRVRDLFEAYLRCGDPHFGFMRLHCDGCGEDKFVPYSCKTRGLCPSCGQKRAIAWAERMVGEVLPDVPYLQLVFTIPRMLRKSFLFNRDLYGQLCRVAYASTREFYQEHFPSLDDPIPAMIAAPQSFGSLLNHHPHIHAVASLGVYDRQGNFHSVPDDLDFSALVDIFKERTFKMLLQEGATCAEHVELIRQWRHSGFQVNSERRVAEGERHELERLLSYIERPPVALRRLSYGDDGMVTYRGNFHPRLGRDYQYVTGVEFLAMLVPHILLRYQCVIRYYGALSTTIRRKFGWSGASTTEKPPRVATDDDDSAFVRARKKNWARLIRKIWLDDPERCPRCGAAMRVVAAISSPAQDDVIEKVLRHLGLWDPPWQRQRRARGPPGEAVEVPTAAQAHLAPAVDEEDDFNQVPPGDDWDL